MLWKSINNLHPKSAITQNFGLFNIASRLESSKISPIDVHRDSYAEFHLRVVYSSLGQVIIANIENVSWKTLETTAWASG
jgi:hypothetical protein